MKRYMEAIIVSVVALLAIAAPTVLLLQDGHGPSTLPVQIVITDPVNTAL